MKAAFPASLLPLLLVALMLSALARAEGVQAPQIKDQKFSYLATVQGEGYTLMYNPQTLTVTSDVRDTTQLACEKVGEFFGGYDYRTTIVIAGNNGEFQLLLGSTDVPDAAEAADWFEGPNGLVVVKSPTMLSGYRQVLAHQIARIVIRTKATDWNVPSGAFRNLPMWYQDGLAAYASGDITDDQRAMATIMAGGDGWMPLDGLERTWRNMTIFNADDPGYAEARAQSAALVDYVGNTYGKVALLGILDDYDVGGDLGRAFVNCTGKTPEAISLELKSWLAGAPAGPPDNGSVEGYLIDGGGTPVAGMPITFTRQDVSVNATTDGQGHFNVSVAPGKYAVSTRASGPLANDVVTVASGEHVRQNLTIAASQPVASPSPRRTAPTDLLLPGALIAMNAIAIVALLAILRRNWHWPKLKWKP